MKNIKYMSKIVHEKFGRKYLVAECLSQIEVERNASAFVKAYGEKVKIDGIVYKIEGIGFVMPKIKVGETIQIAVELKKEIKRVVNKKHKSKCNK